MARICSCLLISPHVDGQSANQLQESFWNKSVTKMLMVEKFSQKEAIVHWEVERIISQPLATLCIS